MSRCIRCGKHKLFMKLQNGLCPACFRAAEEQLERKTTAHGLRPKGQDKKTPEPEPVETIGGKVRVPFADSFDDLGQLHPADLEPSPEERAAWETEGIARSNAFQQRLQTECDRIPWDAIRAIIPGKAEPLTDIEALFLDYLNGHSTKTFQVAGYWLHDYHLNLNAEIQKFFRSGYLQFADIPFSLSKVHLPELKGILSAHHLKVSGKKAELLTRILENVPEEDLADYACQHLQLTESGEKEAEQHRYLLYFFREPFKSQIPLSKAAAMHKEYPELSPSELARKLIQPLQDESVKTGNWGNYRTHLYSMVITYQRDRDDKIAWIPLLQVQLLDALGYENGNVQDPEMAFSAPAIIGDIANYLDRYPETDLQTDLSIAAKRLPVQILPGEVQKVYSMLMDEIHNWKKE